MQGREYGPDEIKRVLERARELQSAVPDTGLTLEELEDIARASGLDPSLVRQAAAELEFSTGPSESSNSTHIFAERVVEGELTEQAWADVIVELRRTFGLKSEDTELTEQEYGVTRSYRIDSDDIETQVYVTPRAGKLHIRMAQRIGEIDPLIKSLILTGIATIILGSFAMAFVDDGWMRLLMYILAFAVSFPAIYAIDKRWRHTKRQELQTAADTLARVLSSSGTTPVARAEVRPEIVIHVSPDSAGESDEVVSGRMKAR